MGKEYLVSIYNPFVGAYCQVPFEQAEKFLGEVDDLKEKVAKAKEEKAKDEAYTNSLKTKSNEK
jgi:hypothetical protein